MRYVKQRNLYSCLPIAIMNVMKWYNESDTGGLQITYKKTYNSLCKLLKTDTSGTKMSDFLAIMKILRWFMVDIEFHCEVNLKDIKAELAKGRALILNSYLWQTTNGTKHTCLLVPDKSGFAVINGINGHTIEHLKDKEFDSEYLFESGNLPNFFSIGKND